MRIYLDSNVFIAVLEGAVDEAGAIRCLLAIGDAREDLFFTSELSLAETLVVPFELIRPTTAVPVGRSPLAPTTLAADYSDLLTTRHGFTVQAVERSTIILAAHVRAGDKKIKLPDAIHLATAEQSGCTHFLTADKDLLKRVKSFQMIELTRHGVSLLSSDIETSG